MSGGKPLVRGYNERPKAVIDSIRTQAVHTVPQTDTPQNPLDLLQTELADLAYDLERQRRVDAADVVMMLHARLRELAAEQRALGQPGAAASPTLSLPIQS